MSNPHSRLQRISTEEIQQIEQPTNSQINIPHKCNYLINIVGLLMLLFIAYFLHQNFKANQLIVETKLKQIEGLLQKGNQAASSNDGGLSSNSETKKINQQLQNIQKSIAVTQENDKQNEKEIISLKEQLKILKLQINKNQQEKTSKLNKNKQPNIPNTFQNSTQLEGKNQVVEIKELQPPILPINIPNVRDGSHPPGSQHSHQHLTFPYKTMGMRQIGKQFNFTVIPHNKYYDYEAKMDEVFKPYKDTNCQFERYGDYNDGGYVMCKNFVNNSVALINLGVEGRDNFGCGLSTQFKFPNYQYDCTNSIAPPCQTNNNKNKFQFACLGQLTESTQMGAYYSLKDIVDKNGLFHKRVTMKIDIEGGQWPGFRTFPIDYLDYVDQFILEIHNSGPYQQGIFYGNLDIIQSLKEKFVSVNLHMNNHGNLPRQQISAKSRFYPTHAIEVTLVNKKLIKLNSDVRSYALNSKNTINNPNNVDYQMQD